ncbi:Co2+/Mg2+ efflux protein ApaG [Sphingobacterium corticibacterium]|uniref:Co2+/Mg2+ efflux protein ApaG n=1 Tax=Sphingobacterium corticibacterium TaxID=2484746 RepID=A0A4Q6XUM7_9SPHI|nr:Co2+/Mg2+ efflux protein ApaG [Sphingobacterium corticibacterium]RZF60327.1 Co2+/Mg2+ efflux protein ApaG [Sphingobacterium corticibacterium]
MNTQITSGVKVSVDVVYQPEYSNPAKMHFMFSYQVTIENLSDVTIQLLNRHWDIFDSFGDFKQVKGEGVVGEQPILIPGSTYQYVSGCNLKSEIGYMTGHYEMIKEVNGDIFHVEIPRFNLIASFKLN